MHRSLNVRTFNVETFKPKKMPTIVKFEDIETWQTARELTRKVYNVTRDGEFARDFGLSSQI